MNELLLQVVCGAVGGILGAMLARWSERRRERREAARAQLVTRRYDFKVRGGE